MNDEVQTLPLLRTLLERQTQCFVPQYIGPVMKMVPVTSWQDYESFPTTKWNIKQPADNDDRPDALDTGTILLAHMSQTLTFHILDISLADFDQT